jgi:hypothetical protein
LGLLRDLLRHVEGDFGEVGLSDRGGGRVDAAVVAVVALVAVVVVVVVVCFRRRVADMHQVAVEAAIAVDEIEGRGG